jgi:hypothetical protein
MWDEACTGPAERKAFMDELGDMYTCEGLDKIDAAVVTLGAYLDRARMLCVQCDGR